MTNKIRRSRQFCLFCPITLPRSQQASHPRVQWRTRRQRFEKQVAGGEAECLGSPAVWCCLLHMRTRYGVVSGLGSGAIDGLGGF